MKKTVGFDLTREEKAKLDNIIARSGKSKIEFFRARMLADYYEPIDLKNVLRFIVEKLKSFEKNSNNLEDIIKTINELKLNNTLQVKRTERDYYNQQIEGEKEEKLLKEVDKKLDKMQEEINDKIEDLLVKVIEKVDEKTNKIW